MEKTQNGVQAWMSSIRSSMANDPCRKLFEDQVQTHAFIFLDDYLEGILAGPKQGPIIELVKTPGRKKHALHRTRAATAAATVRAQTMVSFLLDDDNTTKENLPPLNSFHKALLLVKEAVEEKHRPHKSSETVSFSDNGPVRSIVVHGGKSSELSNSDTVDDVPEITVAECSSQDRLQPSPKPAWQLSQDSGERRRESLVPPSLPIVGRTNELSMIAEGDESPERTRANTALPSPVQLQSLDEPDIHHAVGEAVVLAVDGNGDVDIHCVNDESIHDPVNATIAPANTFYPISLDSPSQVRAGNHTQNLRSQSPSSHHADVLTAPLPDNRASQSAPALATIFVPLNDSPPKTYLQKNRISGFPTLPAPSPLRKSMRVPPQEVVGGAIPSSTIPASVPVPLGKRTSWLMKAREAKAMESTMTRSSNHEHLSMAAGNSAAVAPPASSTLKRKSGEMLDILPHSSNEHEVQRSSKAAKVSGSGTAPLIVREKEKPVDHEVSAAKAALPEPAPAVFVPSTVGVHLTERIVPLNVGEEGLISQFKRTVEGLGARGGKSVSKSFGGGNSAAAALAEARAAAEARVAERNKDIGSHDVGAVEKSAAARERHAPRNLSSGSNEETEGHLSLSDLTSSSESLGKRNRAAFSSQLEPQSHDKDGDESISTTPPNSPPPQRSLAKPMDPVFNKQPQPVFMPPLPAHPSTATDLRKAFPVKKPPSPRALPPSVRLASLPIAPRDQQPNTQRADPGPSSEAVSDQKVTPWITASQDTDDMPGVGSQPFEYTTGMVDEDDSWPLEKLAAAEQGWKPFDFHNVDKEDTWSTIPTESQGLTRSLTGDKKTMQQQTTVTGALDVDDDEEAGRKPGSGQEQKMAESSDANEVSVTESSDMEDEVKLGPFAVNLVEKPTDTVRSDNQLSVASSAQPQVGFFSQATKLVNTMLGGVKKTKPEVKSLQLAAAAAKKQQEEADRKVQRLKEMEARRQAALARKAEEKTRVMDDEKKGKEDAERRKREREENTDKRPLKPPTAVPKKVDDDTTKKRKIVVDAEKTHELKKFPSKDKKDNPTVSKLATAKASLATPATKITTASNSVKSTTVSALLSSAAYNATLKTSSGSSTTKPIMPEARPFKVVSASLKGKAKAKPQDDDMGDKLPSTMVKTQMAARAKTQMEAAKQQTPEVPSETIELPDINSEYSDSEDEDRVRTFDPPGWAQSPELRQALQIQSTVNPDDIFGAIRPLRMEEIFRTRQSRFRARTSSANWSGTDRLTVEEVREYERRMGFQRTRAS